MIDITQHTFLIGCFIIGMFMSFGLLMIAWAIQNRPTYVSLRIDKDLAKWIIDQIKRNDKK